MSRSLNGLSNVFVNTIQGGNAINITTSNSSVSTVNVDIDKQSAKTTPVNTDLFLLEEADGSIKKITYQNLETNIDTNYWDETNDILRPIYTTSSVLVGGTNMNVNNFKFQVEGNSYINGNLLVETDTNSNSRQLLINGTAEITGNSYLNTISQGTWNGSVLDKAYLPADTFYDGDLLTATSISTSATENILIGNSSVGKDLLLYSEDILVGGATTNTQTQRIYIVAGKSYNGQTEVNIRAERQNDGNPQNTFIDLTTAQGSGNSGTANITLNATNSGSGRADIIMTTKSEVIMNTLFKVDSNGLPTYNSLKVLNENSLVAGTNIGLVNNSGAITINATDTDTTYTAGTNLSLSGTQFNMDTTLVGNLTWTGTQTYQGVLEITGPASSLGYINLYSNDNSVVSLKTNVNLGATYDIILPSSAGTLATLARTETLTNKTLNGATFDSVPTVNATIRLNGGSGIPGECDFYDIDGSNYIAIKSQDSLTNNYVLRLPSIDDTLITISSNDTLLNKTISSTTNTITTFEGNGNSTITTPSSNGTLALTTDIDTGIASATNVATQSDLSNTTRNFGNSSCIANINGTSLSVPTSINATPSGLSEGKIIQYDSGLGGGNGSMVFGDNGSSASTNWDTGIYSKQFINFKCGTQTMLLFNNTPANVSSTTFTTDNFNITLDSNNSYQNISYTNSQPLMLLNTASSGTVHSHLVMKKDSSQTDYVILRQNNSGELLVHFENSGDRFKFSKNWEYGHAYAMWYYDNSSFTYFRNPSGTNSANSFAGSYFAFHNNGSAIYSNLPSAGTSSGDYHSFATGGNQFARMDATGSGKITGSWTGSWEGTSDRRLKKNIIPLTKAKETLMKINVYEFDKYDIVNYNTIHSETEKDKLKPFKERLSKNSRKVYGFIAQELCENTEELGKMCVDTNDWGEEEPAYIVDDRPMLACAIKTIQEQQKQIDTLTDLVNEMKITIDKLNNSSTFKNFKS